MTVGSCLIALFTIALAACDGRGGAAPAANVPNLSGVTFATVPDGRRMAFRCSGRGAPTVIFEAGYGADSRAWTSVRLRLARLTRVCAYDRAGSGLSDPGPLPRDGAAIARDLDEALRSAGIEGPFVVVGHSAGGLYARLFAARRVQDIDGLVLLDPTIERPGTAAPGADGLDGQRQRARRCLAASEAKAPKGDPAWKGCFGADPDAETFAAALKPDTWRDQLSELDSIFTRTSDEVRRIGGLLEQIPIYVMTSSDVAAAAPRYPYDTTRSVWEMQHQMLAGSFRHGWRQTVLSSHLIMIDRPDIVAAAIGEMVAASREGRLPHGLPPSETDAPASEDPFAQPSQPGAPPQFDAGRAPN